MEASATTPSSSTADGVTVNDAVKHIASLGSVAEVDAFVEGDDRKTVTEAADRRKAALSEDEATRQLDEISDVDRPVEALPGKPLEAGGNGKALVRVRYPLDSFDSGIDGVPLITAQGVEVDRSKLDAILEAAKTAATPLEEVV